MRLEHYPLERLKKEVLDIAAKYLQLTKYRIFFFGSRVSAEGDERSDIDIGIEGKNEIPSAVMAHIREDLEKLPILYKIEIVDFKNVSPDFRKVAFNNIEPIV